MAALEREDEEAQAREALHLEDMRRRQEGARAAREAERRAKADGALLAARNERWGRRFLYISGLLIFAVLLGAEVLYGIATLRVSSIIMGSDDE